MKRSNAHATKQSQQDVQDIVIQDRYQLQYQVGQGSFGLIHKVIDLKDTSSAVPLVAKISYEYDMLHNEIQVLQMIHKFAEDQDEYKKTAKYIPYPDNYGHLPIQTNSSKLSSQDDSDSTVYLDSKKTQDETLGSEQFEPNDQIVYFIMPRYGMNLDQIFNNFNKQLSPESTYHIGLCLLDILELIHRSGLVYNDLKPDNILIGYRQQLPNQKHMAHNNVFKDVDIYLVDFGIASKWFDSKMSKHILQTQQDTFEGSLYFSSVNQLKSMSTSRRDDIISLFYLLGFFLNKGNLPFMTNLLKTTSSKADIKVKFKAVLDAKRSMSLLHMCTGKMSPLREFARHAESLGFECEPNYDKLRSILHANILESNSVKEKSIYSPKQFLYPGQMSLLSRNKELRDYHREGIIYNVNQNHE